MDLSSSINEKSYDTRVSNPEPEPVFISREGQQNFIKALICIIVDFIATIFLIFVQYGLFGTFAKQFNYTLIIIIGAVAFAFFTCLLIFVISRITILIIISKFVYIGVGGAYYAYRLVLMIIFLVKNEDGITTEALIFFIIILGSILPRVFGFYNLEQLAKVCKKVDENKRILEHEKFVERIGTRVDGGYTSSRWSNTIEFERITKLNNSKINEQQDDKK